MKRFILAFVGGVLLAGGVWVQSGSAALIAPDVVSGGGGVQITDGAFDLQFLFGAGARNTGFGMAKGHLNLISKSEDNPFEFLRGQVEGVGPCNGCDGTLTGNAVVVLSDGTLHKNIPFTAEVTAGGPGVGALSICLEGILDGEPGDQIFSNGDYDGPPMDVARGLFVLRLPNGP